MIRGVFRKIKEHPALNALYIANFFFSLHFFFVVYINSSFLATYVGENLVGVLYIISATISITLFFSISQFLKKVGNYRALIVLTNLELLALLGIGIIGVPQIAVLFFVLHLTIVPIIFFNLDVFLQKSANKESDTGAVRGTFLTISSIAFIIAPLTVGTIVGEGSFQDVYLVSAMLLLPFLSIIAIKFKYFIDPTYHIITARSLLPTLKKLKDKPNVSSIFLAHLLLRVFYIWILVYIPIYLSSHIGFSWPKIGLMLTLMLLPCVLFEFPLGKLADKFLGEKEIMVTGFIIMALSSISISLIATNSFIIWTIVLFMTRTGSTFTEITTESYFFKHVGSNDTEMISIFRMLRPLAYILSITAALISLSFLSMNYIFIVLGGLLLLGVPLGLKIEDTK